MIFSLASCTPLVPYRTNQDVSASCIPLNLKGDPTSDSFAAVAPSCEHLLEEDAPASEGNGGYALHFVEFDDQGELFPGTGQHAPAVSQMEAFLARVRSEGEADAATSKIRPVSVIVFVHGWKHNAQSSDSNVRWFRAMLARLAIVENKSNCPRRVIGLYVGWRGDATMLPDLAKDATFWTRKKAAGRVANGQVRELFGRLRAIQDIRNAEWNGLVEMSRRHPAEVTSSHTELACSKAIRLTIVGHSFGGLIVYNSLGPSLVRDIADLNERIRDAKSPVVDPVLAREGDLIVTINPAVEASAFVPLWQAARAADPRSYHAPVFVSITSANDDATGIAFPAARFFNTLLSKYPRGASAERDAELKTIGHDQDYVDYTLNTLSILNANSKSNPLVADPICEHLRNAPDFTTRFDAEMKRLDGFVEALHATPDANALPQFFPRQFCIHARTGDPDVAIALRPMARTNLNSPVWNVFTAMPVLDSHSDLLNPFLIDFLRQLYEEGTRPETQRLSETMVNPDGLVRQGALELPHQDGLRQTIFK
ncbi:hypothetical protein [Rudaea sp.]|uniref:hypothetical protein n=1 Tax=Rudaea sp. TaxID=2136325 RepID=UPI0032208E2E